MKRGILVAAVAVAAFGFAGAGTASATGDMTHDSVPGMTHDSPGMTHDSPGMTHDAPGMTHDQYSGAAAGQAGAVVFALAA